MYANIKSLCSTAEISTMLCVNYVSVFKNGKNLREKKRLREFPGGAVLGPPHSNAGGSGSNPGWELRFCVPCSSAKEIKRKKKKKIENTYTVGRSIKKSTSKVKGFINMKKKIFTFL